LRGLKLNKGRSYKLPIENKCPTIENETSERKTYLIN